MRMQRKKASEVARFEAALDAKRAARLKDLEIKEKAEGDLTASEYAEMLAIVEKQWQPPQPPQFANPRVSGKGQKTKGAESSEYGDCFSSFKGKGRAKDSSGKSTSATNDGHEQNYSAKGKGKAKSKSSNNSNAIKSALDQQALVARGNAAVDIWDMEVCSFEEVVRAQYRPAGRRAWAVVGIMDGTSGRKEFSGAREGWRVTCKFRNENGATLSVVAFTEQIFWLEEQASLFHDQIVRVGPLKRNENSYTGHMDLHLCHTTKMVNTTELPYRITAFPELCGAWPCQAQWEQEKHARLKAEVVKLGDGDIELVVSGDTTSTLFQVYGLHPALMDVAAGVHLLIEVYPMTGGGEKISEHSIVRLAPTQQPDH